VKMETGARSSERFKIYLLIVLLTAMVAILVYKFRALVPEVGHSRYTPPTTSKWFESQKARFTAALSRDKYDIVIMPIEAAPESLDRVARSMMTRHLAEEYRSRTNLHVPDTTWVIRALGSNAREIPLNEGERLARKLGARYLVEGHVSRPRSIFHFDLNLIL
jgi:hypothetical protein